MEFRQEKKNKSIKQTKKRISPNWNVQFVRESIYVQVKNEISMHAHWSPSNKRL